MSEGAGGGGMCVSKLSTAFLQSHGCHCAARRLTPLPQPPIAHRPRVRRCHCRCRLPWGGRCRHARARCLSKWATCASSPTPRTSSSPMATTPSGASRTRWVGGWVGGCVGGRAGARGARGTVPARLPACATRRRLLQLCADACGCALACVCAGVGPGGRVVCHRLHHFAAVQVCGRVGG